MRDKHWKIASLFFAGVSAQLILSFSLALASQSEAQAGGPKKSQGRSSVACPMAMRSAKREVTNMDNGVRIRVTSDDPAVVKRIQANAAAHGEKIKEAGPRHQQMCPVAVEGANVKVTNLDNGAELEITSDKPEAVKEIQSRAARVAGEPVRRKAPTAKTT
jgi:TusA-related sulfurtransferase